MGLEALDRHEIKEAGQTLEEVYTLFPVLKQMGQRAAGSLSGGQQQQLAIGRVLIRKPRLCCWTNQPKAFNRRLLKKSSASSSS
jgi:urea transport system ATP-binding protein